jgi:hypothetical protein
MAGCFFRKYSCGAAVGLLLKGGILPDILHAAIDNGRARFVTIFAGCYFHSPVNDYEFVKNLAKTPHYWSSFLPGLKSGVIYMALLWGWWK